MGGLTVAGLLLSLLCRDAAGIQLLAGTAVGTGRLVVMGTGALCNRAVLVVRTGEFVCQRVTDKRACGCTDQALKQPASCGLVVNILLSVFAGNGLAVVAVGLRFGRDGVLYGFGSDLVNGIVLLAVFFIVVCFLGRLSLMPSYVSRRCGSKRVACLQYGVFQGFIKQGCSFLQWEFR